MRHGLGTRVNYRQRIRLTNSLELVRCNAELMGSE
jgi:hypothetical protein